jgi:hypothetical protein
MSLYVCGARYVEIDDDNNDDGDPTQTTIVFRTQIRLRKCSSHTNSRPSEETNICGTKLRYALHVQLVFIW